VSARTTAIYLAIATSVACCAQSAPRSPPARPAEVAIDLAPEAPQVDGGPAAPSSDDTPDTPSSSLPVTSQSDIVFAAESFPTGGIHAVDPIALLSTARQVSGLGGDARLAGMVIERVGPVGLVDLEASGYHSRIEYRFVRASARTAEARAGADKAPTPLENDEPGVTVVVDALGMHAPTSTAQQTARPKPLPDPRCTPKRVWAAALRAGAAKDGVAILTYDDSAPGVWVFQVDGATFRQTISDATCDVDKRGARSASK
jgi:hypothetical protein